MSLRTTLQDSLSREAILKFVVETDAVPDGLSTPFEVYSEITNLYSKQTTRAYLCSGLLYFKKARGTLEGHFHAVEFYIAGDVDRNQVKDSVLEYLYWLDENGWEVSDIARNILVGTGFNIQVTTYNSDEPTITPQAGLHRGDWGFVDRDHRLIYYLILLEATIRQREDTPVQANSTFTSSFQPPPAPTEATSPNTSDRPTTKLTLPIKLALLICSLALLILLIILAMIAQSALCWGILGFSAFAGFCWLLSRL